MTYLRGIKGEGLPKQYDSSKNVKRKSSTCLIKHRNGQNSQFQRVGLQKKSIRLSKCSALSLSLKKNCFQFRQWQTIFLQSRATLANASSATSANAVRSATDASPNRAWTEPRAGELEMDLNAFVRRIITVSNHDVAFLSLRIRVLTGC